MTLKRFFRRLLGLLTCSAFFLLPLSAAQAELIGSGSSGAAVYRLQQRLEDLDYFNFKPTGNYGSMTRSAVMKFQEFNGLSADGTAGEETLAALFGSSAKRNPIAARIPFGPTEGTAALGGATVDWSEVDGLFPAGSRCQLIDLTTSTAFRIERTGGTNHAEVEPVSSEDAEAFLQIFGGTPNWSKRAVVVSIDGRRIAASLQGMPHGEDSVSGNGIEGSCCLYFSGSKSDFLGLPDAEHQRTVVKATA